MPYPYRENGAKRLPSEELFRTRVVALVFAAVAAVDTLLLGWLLYLR